ARDRFEPRHHGLALERGLDVRRKLRALSFLSLGFPALELGHHLGSKALQRLADVLVAIAPALLDEDGLVDARVGEHPQRSAQLVRLSDAAGAAAEHLGAQFVTHGDVLLPDVGPPGRVAPERVEVAERELDAADTVDAAG